MSTDIRDFIVRDASHPRYNENYITEARPMDLLLQKIENILLTNKGDVLGDPDFGCNLEFYLWRTDAPAETIKRTIYEQINKYIPEMENYTYDISVDLYEGTYRDIMYVNIRIENNNVNFILK